MEKIEYGSFSGCESLEEIKIPKNITSIEAKAFGGCVNLVNVDFSECDKLEKIGNGAFCDCALSYKFAFPKSSITDIGASAFKGCTYLDKVNLSEYKKLEKLEPACFHTQVFAQ